MTVAAKETELVHLLVEDATALVCGAPIESAQYAADGIEVVKEATRITSIDEDASCKKCKKGGS